MGWSLGEVPGQEERGLAPSMCVCVCNRGPPGAKWQPLKSWGLHLMSCKEAVFPISTNPRGPRSRWEGVTRQVAPTPASP